MGRYAYEDTSVPVGRSQDHIRQLLQKHGAKGMQFGENFETGDVMLRFAFEMVDAQTNKSITIPVRLTVDSTAAYQRFKETHPQTEKGKLFEQAKRSVYRFLHYWLKANLEAVEFGLVEFGDVFLSALEITAKGKTVTIGEMLKPRLVDAISSGKLQMIPWLGEASE